MRNCIFPVQSASRLAMLAITPQEESLLSGGLERMADLLGQRPQGRPPCADPQAEKPSGFFSGPFPAPLREDHPQESLPPQEVLAGAIAAHGAFIRIPAATDE